jgi:predicted Zn-dependent peptidase
MRTIYKQIFAFLLLAAIQLSLNAGPISFEQYKLKNGLQITLIDYGNIEATSITTYVNVGKKNETPGLQGISGFTAEDHGNNKI